MKKLVVLTLLSMSSLPLGARADDSVKMLEKARSYCSEETKSLTKESRAKAFQDCMNGQNLKGQHGHGMTFYEDGTEIHWLNPKEETSQSVSQEEKR